MLFIELIFCAKPVCLRKEKKGKKESIEGKKTNSWRKKLDSPQCPDELGFSRFRVQTRVKIATHGDFSEPVFFLLQLCNPPCIHPSSPSSTPPLRSRQTIVRIVRAAPPPRAHSLALTARGGCYGDQPPPPHASYAHSAPPTTPSAAVYGQESVTPTFQVDDLHCIRRGAMRAHPTALT